MRVKKETNIPMKSWYASGLSCKLSGKIESRFCTWSPRRDDVFNSTSTVLKIARISVITVEYSISSRLTARYWEFLENMPSVRISPLRLAIRFLKSWKDRNTWVVTWKLFLGVLSIIDSCSGTKKSNNEAKNPQGILVLRRTLSFPL